MPNLRSCIGLVAAVAFALIASTQRAAAHCDTLDGPVVAAARIALQQGNVAPVLKWVKETEEAEVREAFTRTMTVRPASPEARELADRYFFETLVRLHRQGEGEPYTGLKPAGTPIEPAIAGADRALATGSVDDLVTLMTERAAAGIRERFALAQARRTHADESVTAGREYVKAYVEFIQYAEQLQLGITGGGADTHHTAPTASVLPGSR